MIFDPIAVFPPLVNNEIFNYHVSDSDGVKSEWVTLKIPSSCSFAQYKEDIDEIKSITILNQRDVEPLPEKSPLVRALCL